MIPRRVQVCALTLLCLVASGTAQAEPCRSGSFEGASYIICSFDLTKDDIRIYWRDADGKPYRTFAALAAELEAKGKSLRFAMNGGMYQGDLRPVGLYIENGRELTRANTATITGPRARYPTSTKSRTASSISAPARRASSRRVAFSPTGRKRISPRSQDRCSSSTAPSTLPSSWIQSIASRGMA
jgi:hypothetical protein